MSRNPRDAAPRRRNGRRAGDGKRLAEGAPADPVSPAQVVGYLRRHPDFLCQHPELLDVLTPPARNCGDGVADLQQFMVEKLRRELTDMAAARDALVATGRSNLSAQARVHKAALSLIRARTFEHFIETVTTDLVAILDLDVVAIGVEQATRQSARPETPGVYRLEPDTVERLLGPGQDIALRANVTGHPMIFGPGSGLVRSEALIRLAISRATPPALLAFGSRQPEHFQPGQGTELLGFLARVVECSIRGWLNLPE